VAVEVSRKLPDPTRYSSYWKLLRVTAWILRFRQIALRRDGHSGHLTALEMEAARSYWIQAVQGEYFAVEFQALREKMPLPDGSKIARFNPLLDEGFIRLGGRLHFAKPSRKQRHTLLSVGRHHFTKFLILQTHIRLHHLGVHIILAEPREEFWILRARQTYKKVLHLIPPLPNFKGAGRRRSYHEVRRADRQGPKFKVGDIVLLDKKECRDTCGRNPGSMNYFRVVRVKSRRLASASRTEPKSVVPCSWSSPWRLARGAGCEGLRYFSLISLTSDS